MENRNFRVNWSDIISKILFLIVFVLILVWFFPSCNNTSKDESVLDKYNFSVLFDRIYKDNLNEMKSAAKGYFTKERMPEAGEEKTLTLQEMYDMNLLLPLMDKNDNACDAKKSIVKVTKNGNEYRMNVSLTCGNETKDVTEIIGCYDFCTDGSCKGQIATNLQYQFMREVTNTTYSCPSGYTLKGKYCYTSTFGERIDATPVISEEKTYYEDAKKNTDKNIKIYTEIIKTQGDPTYVCPTGYTLSGTVCTKVEYTEPTIDKGYTCPTGYTLNNNYCYKTSTISATPNYKYTCPTTYVKNADGKTCSKTIETSASDVITGYNCPSGCKLETGKNTCTTSTTKAANAVKTVSSYSCPSSAYTLSGKKCTKKTADGYTSWKFVQSYSYTSKKSTYTNDTAKLVYDGSSVKKSCTSCRPVTYYNYSYYTRSKKYKTTTIDATANYKTTYNCNGIGGTLSGKNCIITDRKTCDPIFKKECKVGTLVGNICRQVSTIDASKEVEGYTCPAGYDLVGTTCTHSDVIPATEVEEGKTCPQGYEMIGDTCKKTTTTPATEVPGPIIYSCPEGFIKEADNSACYRIDHIEGDYYCETEGAELIGKQCKVTVPGGQIIGYTCPTGYVKDGAYCYTKVTKKINATSKTVVTYQYKWSYSTTLAGWTRTGRTRSV